MLLRYASELHIFLKLNVIRTRCSAKPAVQRVHLAEQMQISDCCKWVPEKSTVHTLWNSDFMPVIIFNHL